MFSSLLKLPKTAGFRLTLWFSAFFTAGILLLFAAAYQLLSTSLAERDRDTILSKYWDLAGQYQEGGVESLQEAVRLQEKQTKTRPTFVRFSGPGMEKPFESFPDQWTEFDHKALDSVRKDKLEHWVNLSSDRRDSILEILSLRLADGLLLQVGRTSEFRQDTLRRFRQIVGSVILLSLAVSLPGGVLLARRVLAPVRGLVRTVLEVRSGAVGARVPVRGAGDEFDELALIFNDMLSKIEVLIAGMKNALDNVAHDLRTPMTRLRAGAEAALASEAGLLQTREALADCVEESDRIVRMLETLMELSEAETGIMKLDLKTLDLAGVLKETAELYSYAAEEKGLSVVVREGGVVLARVDENRLRQAVANLLDNAVKYTPKGGTIELSVRRGDGEAEILVGDSGAGIAPHELPKIWDRLYRGDRSRSQKGLGLGLSLVKAVALAHKGRVSVESVVGKGSRFSLVLPEGADIAKV